MLSDSGASDSPASIALYSSTICRKIGSTIIAPPSAICCSSCCETPSRKHLAREQVGIDQRRLALALAPPQPRGERRRAPPRPTTMRAPTGLAALLPGEDAEHDAAHAERPRAARRRRRPAGPGVGHVAHIPSPDSTIAMTTASSRNADAPRQVGGDEAAEQRPDGGRDRRRRADQRVHPASAPRPRSCRGSATASPGSSSDAPSPPIDRPEDDDRRQALGEGHRQRADRRSRAGRARRPACGR